MSNIDTATAAEIDAEFEAVVAQPVGLTAEQVAEAKAQAIADAVDSSAVLDIHKGASEAAVTGYEATFHELLGKITRALEAGAKVAELAEAFKADNSAAAKRGEGRPHTWASAGAISGLEAVGSLLRFDEPLPEGFVWRTAKDGTITLLEGEKSLTDLVVGVIRPADSVRDALRDYAKGAGIKPDSLYGKKLADQIVTDAGNLADAIAAFQRTAKQQAKTAKDYLAGQEQGSKGGSDDDSEGDEEPSTKSAEEFLALAIQDLRSAKGAVVNDRDALEALINEAIALAQDI